MCEGVGCVGRWAGRRERMCQDGNAHLQLKDKRTFKSVYVPICVRQYVLSVLVYACVRGECVCTCVCIRASVCACVRVLLSTILRAALQR
jgi:hypothetical protein